MLNYFEWNVMDRIYPDSHLFNSMFLRRNSLDNPVLNFSTAAGETFPIAFALRSDENIHDFNINSSDAIFKSRRGDQTILDGALEARIVSYQRYLHPDTTFDLVGAVDSSSGNHFDLRFDFGKLQYHQNNPTDTDTDGHGMSKIISEGGKVVVLAGPHFTDEGGLDASKYDIEIILNPGTSDEVRFDQKMDCLPMEFQSLRLGGPFSMQIKNTEILSDIGIANFPTIEAGMNNDKDLRDFANLGTYSSVEDLTFEEGDSSAQCPLSRPHVLGGPRYHALCFEFSPQIGEVQPFPLFTAAEFRREDTRNGFIPANEATCIWLEFTVNPAAERGIYDAVVTLTGEEENSGPFSQNILVRFAVQDMHLIPLEDLPMHGVLPSLFYSTAYYNVGGSDPKTDEMETLEKELKLLKNHGFFPSMSENIELSIRPENAENNCEDLDCIVYSSGNAADAECGVVLRVVNLPERMETLLRVYSRTLGDGNWPAETTISFYNFFQRIDSKIGNKYNAWIAAEEDRAWDDSTYLALFESAVCQFKAFWEENGANWPALIADAVDEFIGLQHMDDLTGIDDFSKVHIDGCEACWPIEHPWALFEILKNQGLPVIAPLKDDVEGGSPALVSDRLQETLDMMSHTHMHGSSIVQLFLDAVKDYKPDLDLRVYNLCPFWYPLREEKPSSGEDMNEAGVTSTGYKIGKERLAFGLYLDTLKQSLDIGFMTQFTFSNGEREDWDGIRLKVYRFNHLNEHFIRVPRTLALTVVDEVTGTSDAGTATVRYQFSKIPSIYLKWMALGVNDLRYMITVRQLLHAAITINDPLIQDVAEGVTAFLNETTAGLYREDYEDRIVAWENADTDNLSRSLAVIRQDLTLRIQSLEQTLLLLKYDLNRVQGNEAEDRTVYENHGTIYGDFENQAFGVDLGDGAFIELPVTDALTPTYGLTFQMEFIPDLDTDGIVWLSQRKGRMDLYSEGKTVTLKLYLFSGTTVELRIENGLEENKMNSLYVLFDAHKAVLILNGKGARKDLGAKADPITNFSIVPELDPDVDNINRAKVKDEMEEQWRIGAQLEYNGEDDSNFTGLITHVEIRGYALNLDYALKRSQEVNNLKQEQSTFEKVLDRVQERRAKLRKRILG